MILCPKQGRLKIVVVAVGPVHQISEQVGQGVFLIDTGGPPERRDRPIGPVGPLGIPAIGIGR